MIWCPWRRGRCGRSSAPRNIINDILIIRITTMIVRMKPYDGNSNSITLLVFTVSSLETRKMWSVVSAMMIERGVMPFSVALRQRERNMYVYIYIYREREI